MKAVTCALVLLSVALQARSAGASCGIHHWFGADSGTTIPSVGVIYWAGDHGGAPDFQSIGAWGTLAREAYVVDGEYTPLVVHRLSYAALPGRHRVASYAGGPADYVVDPHWSPPAAAPRLVSLGRRGGGEWEAQVVMQLDQQVAAVRLRWRGADGIESERVVPPVAGVHLGPDAPARPAQLILGPRHCTASPVPIGTLRAGVRLELIAIRHDGSEIRVEGTPPWIDLDELPEFVAVMPDHAYVGAAAWEIEQLASGGTHVPPRARNALVAALVTVLVGVGWLVRRRRRPRTTAIPS